jgi:hypothetical protein
LEQIGSNGQLRVVPLGVNLFLAQTVPGKLFVLPQREGQVAPKAKPPSLSGKVGFQARGAPLSSNGKKRAQVAEGVSKFRFEKPEYLAVSKKGAEKAPFFVEWAIS